MYRKVVYLPIKLIHVANDEGWLRSLAYFVRLKSVYKNGTFYNFSLRWVAELIKCSPAALAHHLRILEAKGLIRYHSGNMTLTGLSKIDALFSFKKHTEVRVDYKNQFDILRSLVLKSNLQRQAYRLRRNAPRIRKGVSTPPIESSGNYIGLSCKGIGRLYGLSKESGSRIRKKLENLKILKCTRQFHQLFSGVGYSQYRLMKSEFAIPSYARYYRGVVYFESRMKIQYIPYVR